MNAALLVWALSRFGLSDRTALVGGAIFLVHPANVEAVAWISQLRTLLALGAGLGALLLYRRLPLASPLLLAFGLLAKATAAFVLPLLAVLYWIDRRHSARPRFQGVSPALCGLFLCVYAPLQLQGFAAAARPGHPSDPDLATQLRTMAALGARYLAMAATGYGTAFGHGPDPVRSNLDPRWLAGATSSFRPSSEAVPSRCGRGSPCSSLVADPDSERPLLALRSCRRSAPGSIFHRVLKP